MARVGIFLAAFCLFLTANNSWAKTIQEKVSGISPLGKKVFNIKGTRWVDAVPDNPATPADESFPGYGFLVGCVDCHGAQYDPITGNITNFDSLEKNPTSWIYRIPQNWNQKVIIQVPPGFFTQTFFVPYNLALLKEGYAVAIMYHASPFGELLSNQFILGSDFHAQELQNHYLATAHVLKAMGAIFFGPPHRFLSLGASSGVLRGNGLFAGHVASPFEAYVMVSGGLGTLQQIEDIILSFSTDERMGLTCVSQIEKPLNQAQRAEALADRISMGDREYSDLIRDELAIGEAEEAYQLSLDYRVEERPKKVQREWSRLEFETRVRAPVIIVTGGRDNQVNPSGPANHAERILEDGNGELMFYIFKNMGHSGPTAPASTPVSTIVDAIHKVDAWVESGNPPATNLAGGTSMLAGVAAVFASQPACGAAGLPADPVDCLSSVLGDGFTGFCSADPVTACVSDNPVTAALNEDNCAASGKGSCELVSPFPSECSEYEI